MCYIAIQYCTTDMHNPRYMEIAELTLPKGMCFWVETWPDGSKESVIAPTGVMPAKIDELLEHNWELADTSQWQPAWTLAHLQGRLQSASSKEQYDRWMRTEIFTGQLRSQSSKEEYEKLKTLWEELRTLLIMNQDIPAYERNHLLWKMSYVEQFFFHSP